MDNLKLPSKLTTFEDVQRALQDVEKSINQLSTSVNYQAEGEVTDKDGKTGDTRITQNKDKSYTFEIKTSEGWKTPVIGESAVKFKGKPSERSKFETKSIDELQVSDDSTGNTIAKKTIYDEKADKFILPRPDYDSGWVTVVNQQTAGTHSLGSVASLQQVWWSNDSGVTIHRLYSSNSNSYSLELTSTTWTITGSTYYGYYRSSGTTLTSLDFSGFEVKVLLWK
jgi:hypothetical protein